MGTTEIFKCPSKLYKFKQFVELFNKYNVLNISYLQTACRIPLFKSNQLHAAVKNPDVFV